MAIAERTGALLISADSRQVYRQFDIGTAKPSIADRARVDHRGIDLIDPTERFSAAQWAVSAAEWMQEADANDRPVVIVGGTGFYLRALETPLFESPFLEPVARERVLAELETQPTGMLRTRCLVVDPERAHLGRTQLLRALETFALTDRPLSDWMRVNARPAAFRGHYLVVDPGAALREQIARRVHQMLEQGWESEVARLATGVPPDAPAWNGCGYGELRAAAAGATARAHAVERTIIDTRQYAKRQRTWFRHQLPAERVTPLDPNVADALTRAFAWWESASLTEHL